MERSPSWGCNNFFSSQIPCSLWLIRVNYRVRGWPPPIPVLVGWFSVDALPSSFYGIFLHYSTIYSYVLQDVFCLNFEVLLYTECNRKNVRDFGRVFLRSNYTDITQNTYIQSSMVTEILVREKCGLLWYLRTVLCLWRHTRRIPKLSLDAAHSDLGDGHMLAVCIVVGSQWATMKRVRVFL